MKRIKRNSIFITALLAVLCGVLSSTDLLIREEVETVKKITVFTAADTDASLEYYKKGLMEAASESRADVNTVNLSSDEQELLFYLQREYDRSAQAVIVFTENRTALRQYLEETSGDVPVIMVQGFGDAQERQTDVSFDVEQAAQLLNEEIEKDHGSGTDITLLTGEKEISEEIAQILKPVLQDAGFETEIKKITDARKKEPEENQVFVGCWSTETEQAAEFVEGGRLYGVGYSSEILNAIRQGKVAGVAAFRMYEVGVYAMRQAVAAAEKEKTQDIQVSCRMITAENLEEEQEFLIPVV